jgi:hypothetical protein
MSQVATIMRPGVLLYLSAILAVSGCGADYLNHYDSVSLALGDANRANGLAQTVNPFNPNSQNTRIEGDGQRIAGVIQNYRGPPAGAAASYGDNCPTDGRTAADGSRCGKRSAASRPGGAM